MPNRVQKLPLTAYDVLGYLIPGATFLVLALYCWHGLEMCSRIGLAPSSIGGAALLLIWLVLAYITGHALALWSTFSIERLAITFFGYPSHNLIRATTIAGVFTNLRLRKWRSVFLVALAPFTFFLLVALTGTGLFSHFVKSIDSYTVDLLTKKFRRRYGRDLAEVSAGGWFTIIMHDVLNYNQIGAARMYNYLNLYGFCRNTACALSFVFVVSVIKFLLDPADAPYHLMIFAPCALFGSWLLTLGFLKFFRRYSLETVMTFVVCQDERDKSKPPFHITANPRTPRGAIN